MTKQDLQDGLSKLKEEMKTLNASAMQDMLSEIKKEIKALNAGSAPAQDVQHAKKKWF